VHDGHLHVRALRLRGIGFIGFIGFIGVQLGGIGLLAPERLSDLARLGLRAMVGGTLACFMTAGVAGILI
jgi:CNT family concentrative nucleoside transporter